MYLEKGHFIGLDVIAANHFVVGFGRPGRIEVTVQPGGGVVATVYEYADAEPESEPIGGYDTVMLEAEENESWVL